MLETRAFIHQWEINCWKCGEKTPVLWAFRPPNNQKEEEFDPLWIGAYEVDPDQDPPMGEAVASRFAWYRSGYSHTMRETVFANFCTSCDSLQGNWYVSKDLRMQMVNGATPEFGSFVDYETNHDAEKYLTEGR